MSYSSVSTCRFASLRPHIYNLKCYRAFRVLLYLVFYFLRYGFPFFVLDMDTQNFSVFLRFTLYGLPYWTRTHRTSMCLSFFSLYGLQCFGLVHTGYQCEPPFLFVWSSFLDSNTHNFSIFFSYYVDTDFFAGYATARLLSVFRLCGTSLPPSGLTFMFRTHHHTSSSAVASAPPFSLASSIVSSSLNLLVSLVSLRHG